MIKTVGFSRVEVGALNFFYIAVLVQAVRRSTHGFYIAVSSIY